MKRLTKIAAILFAYCCDVMSHFWAFVNIPLYMLVSYCAKTNNWRTRRCNAIKDCLMVIAHITPPFTWMCLTIVLMEFWGGILESYVFFEDHTRVANGSMILLGITILPVVIWWIRNKDFVMDVENNLRLGENHKTFWVVASLLFFLLQIAMPFVMLWFIAIL